MHSKIVLILYLYCSYHLELLIGIHIDTYLFVLYQYEVIEPNIFMINLFLLLLMINFANLGKLGIYYAHLRRL